jgi:peptide/nickel transport system permease protein
MVVLRSVWGVVLLVSLSFASFGLLEALPGDPVDVLVAAEPGLSAAEVARQRSLRGLDQPFFVQWWRWLVGHHEPVSTPEPRGGGEPELRFRCGAVCALAFDASALGWSWATKRPIVELLWGPRSFACGDGVVDAGEGCDDGNDVDDDSCDRQCAAPGTNGLQRLDRRIAGALVSVGRLGNTLWLTVPALFFSMGAALVLGTWAARRKGRVDVAVRTAVSVVGGVPTFVVALALLALCAVHGRFLPTGGLLTPGIHEQGAIAVVVDRLRHMVLPLVVLTLSWTARFVRPVHAAVTAVDDAGFVVAAFSRGLTPRAVFFRHVLPHAALPLVTLVGLSLPALVGGALLTETIFAWPGLGRLQYDSLMNGDSLVAVVVLLLHAAAVVFGSLVADFVAWWLDPRLRAVGPMG